MTLTALVDTVARRRTVSLELSGQTLALVNRYLRPGDGWASVLLLALNLMVVVWSVEKADWAPTPNLVSLVLWAMLTGLVLSRLPFWGILVLPAGLLIGLGVVIRELTSFQAPGLSLGGTSDLLYRLELWWTAARSGSISLDSVPFAFALMVLTWLSGYLAAWVFFRHRNFWGVFILGGAGLISNLTYLPPNASAYLALYLFTGLLLVARVRSVRRRQEWTRRNFQFDNHLGLLSLSDSVLLAGIVLSVAFIIPAGQALEPAHQAYEVLRSPMKVWEDDFNRLFAGLPARKPLPYRLWSDVMAFQGTINPTTTQVLQVNSPAPLYWKARSYNTYTSKGWVAEDTVYKPLNWRPTYASGQTYLSRATVTYTVTPGYAGRNLFMAGQAMGSTLDARIETYDSPLYTLDLSKPLSLPAWPPRLAKAAQGLAQAANAGNGATDAALAKYLQDNFPDEFRLVTANRVAGVVHQATLAEVVPEQPDVLSLRVPKGTVAPGQTYQITSSVSFATPRDLRRAGTDYPTWVLTRYTQLPPEVPQRVRDLAAQITGNARNPYDKVKAIEDYLGAFQYTLKVDPPPYNVDGVDHFLFTLKRGYSEYFASSTVVLARSVGIPARLATGYTMGDKQGGLDLYSVKDSHSHAWVEVFFPNYGWIPFEPTPGADLPGAFRPGLDSSTLPANATAPGAPDLLCADEDGDDCFLPPDLGLPADSQAQGPWFARWGGTSFLALVGAVTGALAAGAAWLAWRRYVSPSPDPQIVFRNLGRLASLSAAGPAPHQTPLQYRQRLEEALPQHQGSLSVIVNAYVRHRYGKKELTDAQRGELTQAWLALRVPLLLRALQRRTGQTTAE